MKTEILAPAGDERAARAAIRSGADAVYLGFTRFSARSSAENFGKDALRELAEYAHLLGVKVYVCLNTLVKDSETEAFFADVKEAWEAGADAVLMQDMFLGKRLKEAFPEITLHLSTQAGCCNEAGAELARACGFSRAVLARETPLSEIARISRVLETEVFVQGALCTAFSGQCYLSSFAGNNSGNRGRCKQPCRKRYSIDRAGFGELAYALSPSDLSVGERVRTLAEAGVCSFKIEGRLRRTEYVAAAVAYYRALLAGKSGKDELTDLKRAYNRGDYTAGLAFGQDASFLSRRVQGHIGDAVGVLGKGNFCRSAYLPSKADGFKILRNGAEVGGAVLRSVGEGGFFLSSSAELLPGDEVRLTTEAALGERLARERKLPASLSLYFRAGEPATVSCGGFCYTGPVLQPAERAPLTEEELKRCFSKTDGLPFDVRFSRVETEGAFLPKSRLNGIRREFFAGLVRFLAPPREPLKGAFPREEAPLPAAGGKTAVLARGPVDVKADIFIFKPRDYTNIPAVPCAGAGERFLYLPPFLTSEDERAVAPRLSLFDGVYCDGYYGLALAQKYGKTFFAGTGWNVTNRFALAEAKRAGAKYVALSKELSEREQSALSGEGVFTLERGGIKVMDLIYCPFGKSCASCDRRDEYLLTDEEGRKFPLLRYRAAGEGCRFEVYNCALLSAGEGGGNRLFDLCVPSKGERTFPVTGGHRKRSML